MIRPGVLQFLRLLPPSRAGARSGTRLDPTEGGEIDKTRPSIVLSTDAIRWMRLRIVVPLTEWKEKHEGRPWCFRIEPDEENGLVKVSAADALQIRCVSLGRFQRKRGRLQPAKIREVVAAVVMCVEGERSE